MLTPFHRLSPFLARAATTGSEQVVGHVGPCEGQEKPPASVPFAVIDQRASSMFSGNTGAVGASGEGLATSAPSYGVARDVMAVVDGRVYLWPAVAIALGRCHAVGVAESGH